MIPGGTDVVIETQRPVELMEFAVRLLFTYWKDAVVENPRWVPGSGDSKVWSAQNYFEIPFGLSDEMFVYRNKKDYAVAEANADKLNFIHLLRRDGELTVVMAPDSEEGFALVDALKSTKFPQAS